VTVSMTSHRAFCVVLSVELLNDVSQNFDRFLVTYDLKKVHV